MDDKVMLYLVHFDGHLPNYGSENYLLGVYSTIEKAEEAVMKLSAEVGENFWSMRPDIEEVELDFTYALRIHPDLYVSTPIFLGGYAE